MKFELKSLLTLIFFAALLGMACRKPFDPGSISGFSSALIVEGVINPTGVTNIYLSRTLDINDKSAVRPELSATVQVLSENNTAVTLTGRPGGLYTIPQLSLNSSQKYRLRVRTASGTEYMSDPMAVRNTPAIDSVNWVRGADGVGIYINTHDSQNNTRYYQWDFEEDWELRSLGSTEYKAILLPFGGVSIILRDPAEIPLMQVCYKSQRSNSIDVFSTAKLQSDIVSRHPIMFIPNNSDKLSVRYSILVRQHAIPFEAFEYLSMMKRNSEELGSFFDAQPSELVGNIRNVNDKNDVAIGYVVIAPVLEKRIFITRDQVPAWPFKLNCEFINVVANPDSMRPYYGPGQGYLPDAPERNDRGVIVKWHGITETCLDCRARGGNNNKPGFW